jgi:ribosomal protein L22
MTEKNYAPSEKDKKISGKKIKAEAPAVKAEEKKEEPKAEGETENKKGKKIEVVKKDRAIVHGASLPVSKKHSMSICKMIKGKTPDKAITMLESVVKLKWAVPMNNREVPHRKGNIMAGRYPVNASRVFIDLLKQLKANSSVNGIDNPIIAAAKADKASRPHRRGGTRAKRTHIYLEARELNKPQVNQK